MKRKAIKSPTGSKISCKGWMQEAALRMLCNSLDSKVAEKSDELIVYGGTGKAARNWEAFDNIIKALRTTWLIKTVRQFLAYWQSIYAKVAVVNSINSSQ